jgi:ribosomal protein S7
MTNSKQILSFYFYNSIFYNRILNKFILHGKKEKFELYFQKIFLLIARNLKMPIFFFFFEILEKQLCFVATRRLIKKKKSIFIPYPLTYIKRYWVACSFFVSSVKNYKSVSFKQKLFFTLLAYFNSSKVKFLYGMLQKQELYSYAIEKRTLLHYR